MIALGLAITAVVLIFDGHFASAIIAALLALWAANSAVFRLPHPRRRKPWYRGG